ncbi:uncharacterized protein BDW70DRAFT_153652 [Aspergillus foveolatus]|uniref:uncharacterized protein n=1 Tax=Aspergillus foveolatus TaxID=210207 RepID=UPI003CCE2AEB
MEDNASESAVPSAEECRTAYEKGFHSQEKSQKPCYIPPLERHLQIPFKSEENHLAMLVSACIFSARWAGLMPKAALAYTDSKAHNSDKPEEDDSAMVDIGVADDDAARWWAAILAPTEGWEAYIAIGKDKFRSPWSISLPADLDLSYRETHYSLSDTAVSAATAFHQAYAALSIVLLLPLLRDSGEDFVLPRPKFRHKQKHKLGSSRCNVQLNLAWVRETHYLDKLLTLSCNTRGTRSLLSSVFYEPSIACKVVSPWLQAMFAVVNYVKDNRVLAYMRMSRVPHLAFLWAGGAIVGIHKRVLQDSQFGLIPTEPHAAMWSGTIQSFMQERVHPAAGNHILRSDECRLLYLTQEEHHTHWPVCQWKPFGATALNDTEIDVRLHASCTGHGLQYAGFKWTCRNGRVVHQNV